MGIVRRQSIRSSIFIYLGFGIGALNVLVLFAKFLTPEQYGLTSLLMSTCMVLSTLATLGTIPVINKFFPFYDEYLSPKKNDLPFLTIAVCIIGFLLFVICSFVFKDFIVRKFAKNSALFLEHYDLIYPLTFFMLLFSLLESFCWGLKKTVLTNFLRETSVRVFFTLSILLFIFGFLNFTGFITFYSFCYTIPCLVLLFYLFRSGRFHLRIKFSAVTRRLYKKMLTFSSYIFAGTSFNMISKTNEIFFIASINGLIATAVYTVGDNVVRFLEVPQRSMAAITTPLLASHWKNKEYQKIRELYQKSTITLLIFGIFIFSLILLNIDNLIRFLPHQYELIKEVILIIGIGKLVDLGTGVNNQIIQTSNYWRFDFFTNIVFVCVAIPLNYFLIHRFGILGAAYTNAISLTLFNLVRFIFIWWKFKMQPFTLEILIVLIISLIAYIIPHMIPFCVNIFLDSFIRSIIFIPLFIFGVIKLNVSEDVNSTWNQLIQRIGINRIVK